MGVCLRKPAGGALAWEAGKPGATLRPRSGGTVVTFLESNAESLESLVLLSVQSESTGMYAPRNLATVLEAAWLDSGCIQSVHTEGSHHKQGFGGGEWHVKYAFNIVQGFRIKIVSVAASNPEDTASADDLRPAIHEIGFEDFTLAQLLRQRGQGIQAEIARDVACTLAAHLVIGNLTQLQFDVSADSLQQANGSQPVAPVLSLARQQGQTWCPILTAEAPAGVLEWQIVLPAMQLCGHKGAGAVRWQLSAGETVLGSCQIALSTLLQPQQHTCNLISNSDNEAQIALSLPCSLQVQTQIRPHPCFLDYVAAGCRLYLMFAVDFSEQNLPAIDARSMHYEEEYEDEEQEGSLCQQSLASVANIGHWYNGEEDEYAVWGFGGSCSSAPCYPLNGNSFRPRVQGIEAVLATYQRVLQRTEMQGPLQLVPVLDAAIQECKAQSAMSDSSPGFGVLLAIISDSPSDVAEFEQALMEAAGLPLLILVVGIGDSDFVELMELQEKESHKADADQAFRFWSFTADEGVSEQLPSHLLKTLPLRAAEAFQRAGALQSSTMHDQQLSDNGSVYSA